MKKLLVISLFILCVAGVYWRLHAVQQTKAAGVKAGQVAVAAPVVTTVVECKPMPVEIRTFGTVEASATVTVKAQVNGLLAEIAFTEGQDVKEGDLLVRIDARPFEATLHQAEAALARTQAQRANAERDLRRVSDLFGKGFVSENDRDQAVTALAVLQASERADAAAIESAQIQLDNCTIRAPISGRTGRRLADRGNLVSADATALVMINALRPVNVSFAVPQQDMERLRNWRSAPGIAVKTVLPEDPSRVEEGRLTFLDNAVDRTTGTLMLKAELPNAENRLWPGLFVQVRMRVAVETNATVIPFRAVQNGQKGTYVYVVQPDSTVTNRPVRITRMVEEESVVGEGLQPGEIVVTDGQQRLGPGSKVQVKENTDPGTRSPESGARNPGRTAP